MSTLRAEKDSEDGGAQPTRTHVPALDGLRGIAILVVILFHFSWAFGSGAPVSHLVKRTFLTGWIGVDLFFVLSGYLISRGLLVDAAQPFGRRLRTFWLKRVLRIFPLYYGVLLVGSLVCLALSAPPPEWPYWVYAHNHSLAFDPDPERWTSHFWSLAVEEQFYFFWPFFLLLVPKRARIGVTFSLLGAAIALRFGLIFGKRIWDPFTTVKVVYRALPTRIDGLLLGSVVAMLVESPDSLLLRVWRRHRRSVLVGSALVLFALAVWTRGFDFYDRRVVAFGYGTLAVCFASVVSEAVDGTLPRGIASLLDARGLREMGRVSYGMYVFHWPLVALGIPYFKEVQDWTSTPKALGFGAAVTLVGIAVTYVLATLSYRYFEMPFLRLKQRF